jgi:hypothetical protein
VIVALYRHDDHGAIGRRRMNARPHSWSFVFFASAAPRQ